MKRRNVGESKQERKAQRLFSWPWRGLCLLFFAFLMKSCSPSSPHSKEFTIAQQSQWPALRLYGKERNFTAFNKELLSAIAKEESLTFLFVSSQNPVEEVKNGQVDAALALMSPKEAEAARLLASEPYFLTGPVLILPRGERSQEEKERGFYLFAIPENSPLFLGLEADSGTDAVIYNDIIQGLVAVKEKKVDGAIYPVLPAYYYTDTFYKDELKIASSPLTDEGIRLVARNTPEGRFLIDKFNQGLKNELETGVYHKKVTGWALPDTGRHFVQESIQELKSLEAEASKAL